MTQAAVEALLLEAEQDCAGVFAGFAQTERINTARVLDAFSRARLAARHFAGSSGYGYDDGGRDALEAVCADIFRAEEAICRPGIASGTHAISLCLFGLLLPGDEVVFATGKPYDTLDGVVGFHGEPGSLAEMGVVPRIVPLLQSGDMDVAGILNACDRKTRVVFFQRSSGYALRPAFSPARLGEVMQAVKRARPDVYAVVDNCYGEFVTADEPTNFGADAVCGSLIKNMGGGLAPTGGYIAGTSQAVARVGHRLTAPGIGREVGSWDAGYRLFFQGLFMAPHTVRQALMVAALTARAAELSGISASPQFSQPRSDIIQALVPGTPEKVLAYCRGLQGGAPVESFVTPVPWDMPGYADPVIMAAGTFVQGASIELSCDAPMRPPWAVYQQGALTYESGRRAVARALAAMKEA